ncbi:MAG: hypothetical protein ACOCQ4_01615 [bacterium]
MIKLEKITPKLVFLALLQLPIIILERTFYTQLSSISSNPLPHFIDIGFGTFYPACDSAMCLFLIGTIIFMIRANYPIGKKVIIIATLASAVLVSNSVSSHLALFAVAISYFLFYTFKHPNILSKSILALFFVFSFTVLFLGTVHQIHSANALFSNQYNKLFSIEPSDLNYEKFLNGHYSRNTAVHYFLNSELKVWGDGPGRYNLIGKTTKHLLGIQGHLLTFYAEIGIIGLLFSYLFLWSLNRWNFGNFLLFLSAVIISLSVNIISDTSFMFVYCLFGKLNEKPISLQSTTLMHNSKIL